MYKRNALKTVDDPSRRDGLGLPVAEIPEKSLLAALRVLQIRSSIAGLGPVSPPPSTLLKRHEETCALTRRHQLPMRFFGYHPLFKGSHIHEAQNCDWAIMNLADDPSFISHGRILYAPKRVIDDTTRFRDLGLNFDTIFIAHEIPKGSVKLGEEVPHDLIAPPPPPRAHFIENTSLSVWRAVGKFVRSAAEGVGTTIAGLAAPVYLDPVLFGVRFEAAWQLEGRPIGMWYYLTQWTWGEDEK